MTKPEFSGFKGRFFAWFLTSPLRRILDHKMGKPDERFLELLELKGDEVVVDAGCGSGYHTLMMAERLRSGRVIGVDVSKEMLARLTGNAKKRGLADRIEVLEADGLALPLDDGFVDRAVSIAVWHHLDDPQKACSELARVLRPGGILVSIDLQIGDGHEPGKHLQGHDKRFGPQDMEEILRTAGVKDLKIETLGKWIIGVGRKG